MTPWDCLRSRDDTPGTAMGRRFIPRGARCPPVRSHKCECDPATVAPLIKPPVLRGCPTIVILDIRPLGGTLTLGGVTGMRLATSRVGTREAFTFAPARLIPHGHDGHFAIAQLPACAQGNHAQPLDPLWPKAEDADGRADLIARSAASKAVPCRLEARATLEIRTVPKWRVHGSSCAATLCHAKGRKRQNGLS